MARVAGVDLPKQKRLDVALRYIYGIGPVLSNAIIAELNLDPAKRVKDLTESEVNQINRIKLLLSAAFKNLHAEESNQQSKKRHANES